MKADRNLFIAWPAAISRRISTAAKNERVRSNKPRLVVNFEFLEWTGSNHVGHIKFVAIRYDKNPLAVVRGMTSPAVKDKLAESILCRVAWHNLCISKCRRFDRRHVLIGLTGLMLSSLVLIAEAPNFTVLMIARALLGIVIRGFWSLATAKVMRLVPEESVPKALGIVYTGNAVATAFAAPMGSYRGGSSAGAASSGRWHPSR